MIQSLAGAITTPIASSSALNATSAPGIAGSSEAPAIPFGGMLQSMIGQASALDANAAQAVTGLLSGQGIDIHDAMIATEKADMAFELALQVRNKAVGAYQQMMSMQF
jgi:flagellar hook-basal body complex protein FliE